jgi:hypothetical protein
MTNEIDVFPPTTIQDEQMIGRETRGASFEHVSTRVENRVPNTTLNANLS